MIANCYFWKWADNDLPGKPTEVHASLLRGKMHPAIQNFDARPVINTIQRLAKRAGPKQEGEWECVAEPAKQIEAASFVLLTRPMRGERKDMHQSLARQLLRHGITCFDEEFGMLGDWFPPKINEFQCGQWPGENIYDITIEELPNLIRRIRPKSQASNPFAVLTNRQSHFVQCFRYSKGFLVEWRENNILDHRNFNQWRAQDLQKLAVLEKPYTREGIPFARNPDVLRYTDTLKIFKAFLLHQPRPSGYNWMNINDWLK